MFLGKEKIYILVLIVFCDDTLKVSSLDFGQVTGENVGLSKAVDL